MAENNKKILLTGGGTAGSVSPLLAFYNELKNDYDFLWIGTDHGPEREMVQNEGISFKAISSGKLRRYFSIQNFFDIFIIIFAFFESLFVIIKSKPDLVMSAGSFVSVPVVWAARILGKKIIIHQQDVRPGLANKLMAPFTDIITVTFEKSLNDYGKKAVVTGNPVRKLEVKNEKLEIIRKWNLKADMPVLMVMGGGTGATAINNIVKDSLFDLGNFCQIIHITGKNKNEYISRGKNYHSFEFLNREEMAEAYAVSDAIVSRSGMSSLTEIFSLEKIAILIPMPDSHQEDNAKVFELGKAALVLNEKDLTKEIFVSSVKKIITDDSTRSLLRGNLKNIMTCCANKNMANVIRQILSK